ncbi:uncharacterized protein LTHEOB_6117 [Lasiodiplodia theobromae]|uniref:uncharacterized protein n=1 Tax=Lasiodiplodia theobromae TaxID=45133 RepID=UPI0015C3DD74|nr:uncharacterized protein LTHEOB_6117 [Lasiodiplodia theobromae]KAF4544547.1 hypothetical protein LTHEOB_6117 [Lasiodiplodia theobromae]
MAPTGKARALAEYVQSSIEENRNLDHKVMDSFSKEPSGWAQVRSFVSGRRSRESASLASKPLAEEVPEAERPAPLAIRKINSRTVDNAADISPISEPDSMNNYIPWDPRITDSAHIETATYVPYARFQQRDVQVIGGDSSPVSSTRSARTVGPAQMQNSELDSVLLMGYAAQRRRRIPNALRPGTQPLSPSSIDEKPEEEEEEEEEVKEPEEPTIPEAVRIAQAMLEGEIPPITTAADDDSEQPPSRSSAPSLPTITITHPSVKDTTRPRTDHPALLLRHKRSNPRLREQSKNRPQTWTSNSTRLRRLNGPLPPTPYDMAVSLGLLGEEDHHRPTDQDSTPATPTTVASASSRISSGRYSTASGASSRSGNGIGNRSSDGSVITIPRRPLGHRDFRPVASRVSGAWGPDDVGSGDTGVGGDEVRLAWVDAPASAGTTVRSPQQWLEQFRPLSFDELNVGCRKEGEGKEEEEDGQTLRRKGAVRVVVGKMGKELWRRSEP